MEWLLKQSKFFFHFEGKISLQTGIYLNLLSQVLYVLSQLFRSVLIVKWASTEALGAYVLGVSLATPVLLFFEMSLRNVWAVDAKDAFHPISYLFHRFVSMVLSFVVLGVLFFFYSSKNTEISQIIILSAFLFRFVESSSDVFYGLFQKKEHLEMVGFSSIAKTLFGFLAFAWVLRATHQVANALYVLVLVWLLVVFLYDIPSFYRLYRLEKNNFSMPWKVENLVQLFKKSFPMGITMLFVALSTNVPRFFIEHRLGAKVLGIFATLYGLSLMGSIVIVSVGQGWSPRISQAFLKKDKFLFFRDAKRLFYGSIGLGLLGVLFSCLLGEFFLVHFFSKDFQPFSWLLPWLMLLACLNYLLSVLGVLLTSIQEFKFQAYFQVFNVLFCIVLFSLFSDRMNLVTVLVLFFVLVGINVSFYLALLGSRCQKNFG